ncbi:hypothetical protein HK100_011478 [Physocladia obscura]|uniref:ERCC4 domain-containing protein n=1 Tax=Physocladia obscura TaxID=109957 RepID=A0AAD5T2M4_9FUNG|nr:hypothetical protein HK100_011478 [Physocladia obscura]
MVKQLAGKGGIEGLEDQEDKQAQADKEEKETRNDKEKDGQAADSGDGLVVAAKGLVHATPHNLVLILNSSSVEAEGLKLDLLTNETTSSARRLRYLKGGTVAVSSRILVVDLLNNVVPISLVSGVIICHAHKITESSTEAFILRLIREKNKVAFIRALSESPESLAHSGILWKLEKTMKLLFLRKVYFWPRFHMEVQKCIDSVVQPIFVRQVRVPMTKNMANIQAAIIDCINESILEIKRVHRFADPEEFSVENALFATFEANLHTNLDPIWHRVSTRTKRIVSDVSTLRRLLGYLTIYDPVAFYSFLESIRAANTLSPLQMTHSNSTISPWLMYDAADVVFSTAKSRVFRTVVEPERSTAAQKNTERFGNLINSSDESNRQQIPAGVEILGEELPKWRVIRDLVSEIEAAKEKNNQITPSGPTLIMVHGERTCAQLSEILSGHIFQKQASAQQQLLWKASKRQHQDIEVNDQESSAKHISPSQSSRRRQRGGAVSKITTSSIPTHQDIHSLNAAAVTATKSTELVSTEFSTIGAKKLIARQVIRFFKWRSTVSVVQYNVASRFGKVGIRGGANNAPSRGRDGTVFRGNSGSDVYSRRRARGGGSGSGKQSRSSSTLLDEEENMPETVGKYANPENSMRPVSLEDGDNNDRDMNRDMNRKLLQDPTAPIDMDDYNANFGVVDMPASIIIRPYATSILSPTGGYMMNGDDDSVMLEKLQPSTVVMYDVDPAFIRRLEVWHALNNGKRHLNVYFVIYDNSVEEQKYLTSLRKEKESFEKLIREKAVNGRVVDPEDIFWRNLDTRIAGGQQTVPAEDSNLVIVDVREFRSALPSLLHTHRMKLRPCTLEVGDYILTPQICVERKSIPDLVGSFKSGRLYTQVEAMCLHYQTPVLLIEFAQGKTFALSGGLEASSKNGGPAGGDDLNSKLALLVITFPKLRIVWSSSPGATAEIFEDLKKDQKEPSLEEAMAIGVESGNDGIDSMFNITPSDMIRTLPGITSKNYKNIMRRVDSIAAMANMKLENLQVLLGEEGGQAFYEFLYSDASKKKNY